MTARDHSPAYVPNPDFTQEDWEDVNDHPELTGKELAELQPLEALAPEIASALRRRGPQKAPTKSLVSLRIDQRVLDHFKATGPGWQSRINAALLKVAGL